MSGRSAQSRERSRRSARLAWADPGKRARMLAGIRGQARRAAGQAWADPVKRQRMLAGLRSFWTRQQAEKAQKQWLDPGRKIRQAAQNRTPGIRKKISESVRRKWADPEYRARLRASQRTAWAIPERREQLRRMSRKVFTDPILRAKRALRAAAGREVRPTKPERRLAEILARHLPGHWRYTGDGSVAIGHLIPDFINVNGQKALIEVFGRYWHGPKDGANRAQAFGRYGFKTLIFWEDELADEAIVAARVSQFIGSDP